MTAIIQTGDNLFSVAKWMVNPVAGSGTHTTIATALTSASSGDTIFIAPGTYTENLTLKAGVNLTAFNCDAITPNVIILGTCTFTAAGTVTISGIQLKTNSNFFLAVTGSAASIVNLKSCYLNCSNNTGISFTTSAALTAGINCYDCIGDIMVQLVLLYFLTVALLTFSFSIVISQILVFQQRQAPVSAAGVYLKYTSIQNPITSFR